MDWRQAGPSFRLGLLLIARGAVEGGHRNVVEPQVHGENRAVVNRMV